LNKILLAAILVSASAAAAQRGGLFELHLGITANSPHAKAWLLLKPLGGGTGLAA
jgi:hypothetical protein